MTAHGLLVKKGQSLKGVPQYDKDGKYTGTVYTVTRK